MNAKDVIRALRREGAVFDLGPGTTFQIEPEDENNNFLDYIRLHSPDRDRNVHYEIFAYNRCLRVALHDERVSREKDEIFRRRLKEIADMHTDTVNAGCSFEAWQFAVECKNNVNRIESRTVRGDCGDVLAGIKSELEELIRDIVDIYEPFLEIAFGSDHTTLNLDAIAAYSPRSLTRREVIHRLWQEKADQALCLQNPELPDGFFSRLDGGKPSDDYIQYHRNRFNGFLHYEVEMVKGGLAVVLHDERAVDGPDGLQNAILQHAQNADWTAVYEEDRLVVHNARKWLVPCGREYETIKRDIEVCMEKLYAKFEPFLREVADFDDVLIDEAADCAGYVDAKNTKYEKADTNLVVSEENFARIVPVDSLLNLPLRIPDYQRPYRWREKNVRDLLSDLEKAVQDPKKTHYRLGAVIVHKGENVYNIVDGQQRIITLMLIKYCLEHKVSALFSDRKTMEMLELPESLKNMHDNLMCIQRYLGGANDNDIAVELKEAFRDRFEVVLIGVSKLDEAFQLFDSQNNRGRPLDPHALLKAFHLREMQMSEAWKMEGAVRRWELRDPGELRELFGSYLFRIHNWAHRRKTWRFSVGDLDLFKGVRENLDSTYAQRARNAMPIFQIGEDFPAGAFFFEMVEHYLELKRYATAWVQGGSGKIPLTQLTADVRHGGLWCSTGFHHARLLFLCAVVAYFDRFGNMDMRAIVTLCKWAFMIRLDMPSHLSFASINKYAIGEAGSYTNNIPVFEKIRMARSPMEIVNMKVDWPSLGTRKDWSDECKQVAATIIKLEKMS